MNEVKEKLDLSFQLDEVEAYTWIHKKDLSDILFNEKECFELEAYTINKKNQFERKMINSFILTDYNSGEGVPYGHYLAFKHYMSRYSNRSK